MFLSIHAKMRVGTCARPASMKRALLRGASSDDALPELTTCGINVRAAGVSDGGLNTHRGEPPYEVLSTKIGRRSELGPLDLVELDEVDVRERALAEITERLELGIGVVDATNEGILIGGASSGLVDVLSHHVVEVDE